MFGSIINALRESQAAFQVADDASSGLNLARDFIASRLLKFHSTPGRDRLRSSRIRGCTVHYRFNRGDIQSIREVLIENTYRLPFPMPDVNSALDLGANIGLWSLWARREYNLKQIIAVEPEPTNAELTRKNFEANGLPGNVIQAAAGGVSGTARFEQRRESNLGQIEPSDSHVGSSVIEVRQLSMAEILNKFPGSSAIDIVKMDIEGAEQAVFSTDVSWLERVRALIIEWHPDRCDPQPMIATLEAAGFEHHAANSARQDNLSAFRRRD